MNLHPQDEWVSISDELIQRVDHLMGTAIGLVNQWFFLQTLIQSKELWKDIERYKAQGFRYQKSANLRYLILNVAAIWQAEHKNKKGEIVYPMNSIPGAHERLPDKLPSPEEFCHDGRKDCARDLREEQSSTWKAIQTIRDKSIAHSELKHSQDGMSLDPFNVTEVELKIANLGSFIRDTIFIVDALNHVVRSSEFTWQDLATRERKIAEGFYGVTDFELSIAKLSILA